MKIALFGNHTPGIYALEYLLDNKIDCLVITPYNGKVHPWHGSLYDFAKSKGVKRLYNPINVNDPVFLDVLRDYRPDVILSVCYDQILNQEALAIPGVGSFNVHPSLLPKYRGVAPLIWAIINGEKYTGITIHKMVNNVDAGDIILQKRVKINPQDTGFTLHLKAAETIKKLIPALFKSLNSGKLKYSRQRGKPSLFTSHTPKVNELNFKERTAIQNNNIIRALSRPLPGAYFYFQGNKIYVWESKVAKKSLKRKKKHMDVFFLSGNGIYVICKNNSILKLCEIDAGPSDFSLFEYLNQIRGRN